MSTALSISDVGLRLIKAYEGFRPVDVELVSGQRVAGYGHRVMRGESLHLSEKKAAKLLLRDLAPYEAMINDSIFAPLSQSQFDALCSLAYNIGPKKFLESDVVRALNNGRVLDAANGFDVWRKGTINGQTYVVDALVRRRTAEKVLFLRPSQRPVRAPRVDLQTVADTDIAGATTAAGPPILEDSGVISQLNFPVQPSDEKAVAQTDPEPVAIDDMFTERRDPNNQPHAATPMRRRDDRPGGVLTLSEVFDDDDVYAGDAADPLIKDLDGFNIDLDQAAPKGIEANTEANIEDDSPFELQEIAEFDDIILPDESMQQAYTSENSGGFPDEETVSESLKDDPFDPSDYIVGAPQVGILELSQDDAEPSPIAAAAAEVSGRLDALMADGQDVMDKSDKKILQFRAKTSDPSLSAEDVEKLRQDNPIYGSLLSPAPRENATVRNNKGAAIAGTNHAPEKGQKDSASRYIASSIAPKAAKTSKAPLAFMVAAGMAIFGGSVGAIMSGIDKRFGSGGEFLSSAGVLLGLMITLGSIYYILKNMRGSR